MCSTRFATTLAYRERRVPSSYRTPDTHTRERVQQTSLLAAIYPLLRHASSPSVHHHPPPGYHFQVTRVHLLHNIYQYPTPSVSCDVGHFVYMRKLCRSYFLLRKSLSRRTTPRSRTRHLWLLIGDFSQHWTALVTARGGHVNKRAQTRYVNCEPFPFDTMARYSRCVIDAIVNHHVGVVGRSDE